MGQQRSEANPDDKESLADTTYESAASGWTVHEMPERIRPREEVERVGVENVADDVLLSLLLRTGTTGLNVVDMARGLMKRYGNLTNLSSASVEELAQLRGIGRGKAQIIKAALEIGKRLNSELVPRASKIRTPDDVLRVLADRVRSLDHEVFWALVLDAKNALKCQPVDVSSGLLDASLVHPREVFREAIRSAAAAVVLAHNHPSGDPTPSAEDLRITKQLVAAGNIVDIKVLDHVIIGKSGMPGDRAYVSMRENGIVEF
ncbi:MAG: DNA repair protein RadC [Verrucomicrobia bacterium]|jgi:DNA repair protein RadC|nr:DNA repair protein RadC [Verrucomicrobiota bacterium]